MAYFQLAKERSLYSTTLGGARAFLSGNTGAEVIFIEQGKSVTVQIADAGRSSPAIQQVVVPTSGSPLSRAVNLVASLASVPDIVSISRFGQGVKLRAMNPGACVLMLDGQIGLLVHVGSFENHSNMEHDLIAQVFRSADPEKMHALNRLLFNDPNNLFNENASGNIRKWGDRACGTVSKVGGAVVFYPKLDYDYKDYYKSPIAGNTRAAIQIDPTILTRGRNAIASRLAKGQPSIVGLFYFDSAIQRGQVNVTGTGGHTVLIVGCSSDHRQFLYIDVWQDGSKLKYSGGYPGRDLFPTLCTGLGLFEMQRDSTRGIDILRSTTPGDDPVFNGSQFLEVVAGPL